MEQLLHSNLSLDCRVLLHVVGELQGLSVHQGGHLHLVLLQHLLLFKDVLLHQLGGSNSLGRNVGELLLLLKQLVILLNQHQLTKCGRICLRTSKFGISVRKVAGILIFTKT